MSIRSKGLQARYNNDEDDLTMKRNTQMMCTLTFVPIDQVLEQFEVFSYNAPEEFQISRIADYLERTWDVPKGEAELLQYAIRCRVQQLARTINSSEGWHNKFQMVVGRHHPSL